ncbi:MAG: helicase-exonuclease AddAB subunit AddA [Lachnospiraceae bacterium]|nr:helicase-exonuclease AddAB subunit AddA [Lachnospiraceae bacterium]
MNFTPDQQRVIDTAGKNILVSASAGSGKTAVLVARIMKKICQEQVDIDHLLIVTFTNAAAAEMRDRIHEALSEQIEKEPQNHHLQKQLVLLMNAHITTIHSFCLYLLKNHFEQVDLDPGFRMADEGEMKLLKSEILDEMLEEYYGEASEEFLEMIESMTSRKKDEGIKEQILHIYQFAMSYPWPLEWLTESAKMYECEDLDRADWVKYLLEDIKRTMADLMEETRRAIGICQRLEGPYMYESALQSDLLMLQEILNADTYGSMSEVFSSGSFATLARKKDPSVSEEARDLVKSIRDGVKKVWKDMKEQYFYGEKELLEQQMHQAGRLVKTMTEFTKEFCRRFAQAKREKSLVDFNDLEHFAIDILMDDQKEYTQAAKELQEHFVEIMTDEYQDSNMVQEIILNAVSKIPQGGSNLFMVGDVKQGIYRFRLARPELFMEKHDRYILEEVKDSERIDLHKNFRSRKNIIQTVNFLFTQLMRKEFGNIQYDESEALFLGAEYEEKEDQDYATEFLILDTGKDQEPLAEQEEYTKMELEARMIAKRIQTFMQTDYVYDKKKKEFRRVEYGDMVILLRTMQGYAQTIGEVLKEYDIPVLITSRTGYFAAIEVQTVLNMLAVVDNPKQDIPLAAVLTSPMGGFSSKELAQIKSEFKEETFYQAVEGYAKSGSVEELREKTASFYRMLTEIREQVFYTPIHSLIQIILKETGYFHYVMAMPGGKQRRGNLEMLIEKAVAYENTSYSGLFSFLRYMEQLRKYDVDFGEAAMGEDVVNFVRIMSIHKSKGLEFPICFLAGIYKNFNLQDTRARLCMDFDYGIGIDCYHVEQRVKLPTLFKKVLARKQRQETVAEELRVLYVALTRAEEKLVITSVCEDFPEILQGFAGIAVREENALSFHGISKSLSYFQWLIQALYRHSSMEEWREAVGIQCAETVNLYDSDMKCKIEVMGLEQVVDTLALDFAEKKQERENFVLDPADAEKYKDMYQQITDTFSYHYPHELHEKIRSKVSVSELKLAALEEEEEQMERIFETHSREPYEPEFMREHSQKAGGTARGNAYHKFMELTAHRNIASAKELRQMTEELIRQGKIDREQTDLLNERKLLEFYGSGLAERMRKAYEQGKLWREQPFLMGRDVGEIYPKLGYQEPETILVQGIIDVFFEEDGKLVLVDYKTDQIDKIGDLVQRYQTQIVQYARALESLKNKEIKDAILYSFCFNEEISVDISSK